MQGKDNDYIELLHSIFSEYEHGDEVSKMYILGVLRGMNAVSGLHIREKKQESIVMAGQ